MDIFKFVLKFLIIRVIRFIFDDITQHMKCIVNGSILILVLCTFKLSHGEILGVDNRLFGEVLLGFHGEVILGDFVNLGIIGDESLRSFGTWNSLWWIYLWLRLGLFGGWLRVKLLREHVLDCLVLDHGRVLVALNHLDFGGVHLC